MANYVVIPAAGTGSRMQAEKPKQYLSLLGKPLILHCLETFSASALIDRVFVVIGEDDQAWGEYMANQALSEKITCLSCGGDTRSQTVLNGLKAIENQVDTKDWVLVHDAARPGLNSQLLNHLIDSLSKDPVGGLLALPVADTIKKMQSDQAIPTVEATIPRQGLWQAQTPQMFRYGLLKQALEQPHNETPTDEAQAVEALGFSPKLVTGDLRNLKVTYPQDLAIVEALMQSKECQ